MDAFISDYIVPLIEPRAWARAVHPGRNRSSASGSASGGRRSTRGNEPSPGSLSCSRCWRWYLAIWQFARTGGFQARPADGSAPLPLLPMAIFLPLLIALPLLIRSKRLAAVLDAVSPAWLVGFQVYRVLGYVFLTRWAAGELPGVFAAAAPELAMSWWAPWPCRSRSISGPAQSAGVPQPMPGTCSGSSIFSSPSRSVH